MTGQAPTLCIHHAPCSDGFTAAWAVWKRFPNVKFHPGVHGQAPPDVTGEHVVIVDFSYPEATLLGMAETAASILILDHHRTAQKDLADLPIACALWEDHVSSSVVEEDGWGRIGVEFDMNRSGAMMAWNYFHPSDEPAPTLIQHVQDRDLWQFKIPGTREIQSWVFSFPYDFVTWDKLAQQLGDPEGWDTAFAEGAAIERKQQKDIAELIIATKRFMTIGGFHVPVVNLPYTMASEAAGQLASEGHAFAAAYYDAADGGARVFSLRSRDGFDVGDLAKRMGQRFGTNGGGHKAAAGFRAPRGWEGE